MLEVEGLYAGYGRLTVLNDVNLKIEPQTVVGLIGANGAGKSTTVKAIAGILPFDRGRILFEDGPTKGLRADEICKLGISLVPQSRELFPLMTVFENLEIACLARHGREHMNKRLEAVMSEYPRLAERRRQLASSLSGGEQQMLAIARALIAEPKLLLLDEPTTGLAPRVVDDLQEIINSLVQAGQTILLVEQNTQLVMALANRVYVMKKGEIVFSGRPDEIADNDDVAKYYLQ